MDNSSIVDGKNNLNLSQFKTGLKKTLDRYKIGSGRITQLSLFTVFARMVFLRGESRAEFLSHYTTDEIKGYASGFPDLQPYIKKYGPREGYWRWSRSLPRKVNRLLFQQLIVFLITIFETFIEDILLLVFSKEPKCLSSERPVSLEEVIKLGDYDSIVNYFTSKRIDDILTGDWYKIVDEFNKLFSIDLSHGVEDEAVEEVFQIRHAVVHSAGIADQKFIDKVKKSKWGIKYELNKELIVNERTLDKMDEYISYVAFTIYTKIRTKFGKG